MNYKEKYEQALERAKLAIKECGDNKGRISMIGSIFPELREPEDERIRKEIIDFIKSRLAGFPECDKYIAWLEKQVTSYTKRDVDDAYLKGVTDTKNEIEKQYEANYQIRKDIATFIFNYRGDIKDRAKWMDYLGIKVYFVEKQSKEKPTDKVEPKFHKGDWVIFNNKHKSVYQIEKIENFQYTLRHIIGGSIPLSFSHEDMIRLWTIQDAKDGDVVVDKSDGTIGIFQSIGHHPDGGSYNDPSYCFLHCRYDDGYFFADFEDGNIMTSDDVIPATKEQRDLLFTKMREAGYEWNPEAKELKKLTQSVTKTSD